MPELPEVERVRRSLEPVLIGRTIADATVHTRTMVVAPGDPPGGFGRAKSRTPGARARPVRLAKQDLLVGAVVTAVVRHGKQIGVLAADGRVVCVHLGMTGQVLHQPPGGRLQQPDHVHVTWRLAEASGGSAGRVVFRDPRRFGGVWTFPTLDALRAERWRELGPDALTLEPGALAERLGRSGRPIKAALLDQTVVAGVGNIYADEACFLAGIDPRRAVADLRPGEIAALQGAVRTVLVRSVVAGGSTLRDYVDAAGVSGGYQAHHTVYGRGGKPCVRCGGTLSSGTVGQRTTVWCGVCQPMSGEPQRTDGGVSGA